MTLFPGIRSFASIFADDGQSLAYKLKREISCMPSDIRATASLTCDKIFGAPTPIDTIPSTEVDVEDSIRKISSIFSADNEPEDTAPADNGFAVESEDL